MAMRSGRTHHPTSERLRTIEGTVMMGRGKKWDDAEAGGARQGRRDEPWGTGVTLRSRPGSDDCRGGEQRTVPDHLCERGRRSSKGNDTVAEEETARGTYPTSSR